MSTATQIPASQHVPAQRLPAVVEWIADLGAVLMDGIIGLGNISTFSLRTFGWLFARLPRRETLVPAFYQIGVLSWPVVALTGTFIGMVLVVQSYVQFRNLHMEAKLGAVINMSLVRELGPVLAATMLAGRVGSAMAAELGTMRVTEQIDALTTMGANPIHYLVVPRFLGCLLLIPALTIMADFMGVVGGAVLRRQPVGDRFPPLRGELAAFCGQFRPLCRRVQESLLWRRHRPDRLLSRFSLRSGRRGRRPRRHGGLRLFVRDDFVARLVAGHRPGRNLLQPVARSAQTVLTTMVTASRENADPEPRPGPNSIGLGSISAGSACSATSTSPSRRARRWP